MIKRIFIAILLAALLMGGYGCMGKRGRNINDGALEYMEEKYGEKFEYVGPWGSSYTTPGMRQILISCGSLPGKEILVVIRGDAKSESYSDNYMDFLYQSQTTDYITQIGSSYFNDLAVTVSVTRSPSADGVLPTTGFEDYIRNKYHIVDARIDIDQSDKETVGEFLNELKQLGVHFYFHITISSTNEEFTAQYFHDSDDILFERRVSR